MKRSLLAILIVAIFPTFIKAQISLQPSIPAVGLVQKSQLWNVLLVNSSAKSYDCQLGLVLRDRATGQEIMTASTGQFTIAPGSKQLNTNIVSPVQYNYILAGIDNNMQGLLPVGLYTACYCLISKDGTLAEECIQFDTEPLTPPMLIQPADSSILEVAPNQFSWVPPAPDGMFDRLHYDVIITEVNEGQKANEAIEENIPFYNEGNQIANILSYPTPSPSFVKDKWYAWQIIARDDRNYAGKSEVWVFKVSSITQRELPLNDLYLLIQDDVKGTYQISSDILHVKYFSYDQEYEAQILFSDERGNNIKTVKKKIVPGDNYLDFPLTNEFTAEDRYRITILDKNNKPHTLSFRTHTNN